MLHTTVRSLIEAGVLIGAGALARNIGLIDSIDAQTGYKVIAYATLPALALQVLSSPGVSITEALWIASAALVHAALTAALGWLLHRKRRAPERALLTGCAIGAALGTCGLPFLDAAFGLHAVRLALVWDLANIIAVFGISYLVMMAGGSPPPALYEHADGGTYRGSWLGPRKQGLGVYAYPSGGQYQGMWQNNLKEGFGVYTFPKGGWYEGEWADGERHGTGVRLMRNGTIKAGRWRRGELEKAMDPLDCAVAVNAAQKAAQAARRLRPKTGDLRDAAMNVASQPLLWAVLAALWLSASGRAMPLTLDRLSRAVASAHMPLVLLCMGVLLTDHRPQAVQAGDAARVLALRWLLPLLAAAAAAALSPAHAWHAAVMALCALSPLPAAAKQHAKQARLNDTLAAALQSQSAMASLVLLPAVGLLLAAASPPPLTMADLLLPAVLPANSVVVVLLAAAAACSVACLVVSRGQDRRRGGSAAPRGAVRMRLDGEAPVVPLPVTILWPGDQQVETTGVGSAVREAALQQASTEDAAEEQQNPDSSRHADSAETDTSDPFKI
ncbi:hypothetical protein CVIRNUC_009650 [Coccomyxa viridis]|uniref:Uncharacterized protein n=1 Tax=Coccomyxa viridis TaxID=1274662 RepID=A0AAV1IGX3_9CHLO|nr:hypothetical protein CVIRNUC_009650 [Coccomyxa viridis]